MKANLGKVDRILRFLLAFWWIGPLAPTYPYVWLNWVLFALGWLALVESLMGFCWLQYMLGIKTCD